MGLTLLALARADCRGFADEIQQKEIEVCRADSQGNLWCDDGMGFMARCGDVTEGWDWVQDIEDPHFTFHPQADASCSVK